MAEAGAQMMRTRSVMLRFHFEEFGPGTPNPWPRDVVKGLAPNAVRSLSVLQTMGSQVWMFYEFSDTVARDEFVGSLSPLLTGCVDTILTQADYDHWTS